MGNKLSNDSKFTKPTGLYTNCDWDEKAVKKLIKGGKVAPRYPGQEEPGPELDKCPICFLVSLRLFSTVHGALSSHLVLRASRKDLHRCCSHTLFLSFFFRSPSRLQWYRGGLNRSNCCRQPICTGSVLDLEILFQDCTAVSVRPCRRAINAMRAL